MPRCVQVAKEYVSAETQQGDSSSVSYIQVTTCLQYIIHLPVCYTNGTLALQLKLLVNENCLVWSSDAVLIVELANFNILECSNYYNEAGNMRSSW